MKVICHPKYEEMYNTDPATAAGRMESILKEVSPYFEVAMTEPAAVDDMRLVHTDEHIMHIKRMGLTYEIALLAAGGAIKAAELAISGEPAFGLIRPPGHHASQDRWWGFCFFSNIVISTAKLRKEGKIRTALILDIDLHFGDGTANIFQDVPEAVYFHPKGRDRQQFVATASQFLTQTKTDVTVVSAGFDRHEHNWGSLLKTKDYDTIGRMVKEFAQRVCQRRKYGVLEGGCNNNVPGVNIKALLDEMS